MTAFAHLAGATLATAYAELSESVYPATLAQPQHEHEPAYLTYVVTGAYSERVGRTTRHVGPGALLFHPLGEEHAVTFLARQTRIFRITATRAMLEAARLCRANLAGAASHAEAARPIIERLRRAYREPGADYALRVDALTCELLSLLRPPATRGPHGIGEREVAALREHLDASLSSPPSLASLAARLCCHPVTLARAFRAHAGCSIGEYLRRRRLELALALIREGEMPLSMVAATAGFADQAHLTRAIRRTTGTTPARLRAVTG